MDLETLLKYSGVNNSEVTQKQLNDKADAKTPQTPKKANEAVGRFADPIYDLIDDLGADPDHPVLNELIRYLDGDTIRDFVSDFRRMNDMPNEMDETVQEAIPADQIEKTRKEVKVSMVAPALEKLLASYKKDAKDYNDQRSEVEAELKAKGMSDKEIEDDIMNGDYDFHYLNIDDLEDKIEALEDLMKNPNDDGERIASMVDYGIGDTSAREEFLNDVKIAIEQDYPELYDKIFMYKVGESEEIEEGDGIYHMCAKSFKHSKLGECKTIHGQHNLLEDGTVTHYDVTYEKHGVTRTAKKVPIAEATDIVEAHHMHSTPKKKKKKKMEDKMAEDFLGDMIRLAGLHQPVEEEQTNESYYKDMMQDVEEGMTKEEFAKKYPASKDEYDKIKAELGESKVQTESLSDDAKMFVTDTMELAQEKLDFMKSIGKFSYTDSDQMEFTDELDYDELGQHPMVQDVLKAIPQVDGEEKEIMKALQNIANGEFVDFEDIRETKESETVEIAKEDLSTLLDLAGISPKQATENELDEYANSPDEDYMDADVQLNKLAGGLNGPKGQHKKEYPGDNPLATKIADRLQAMLDDINK